MDKRGFGALAAALLVRLILERPTLLGSALQQDGGYRTSYTLLFVLALICLVAGIILLIYKKYRNRD